MRWSTSALLVASLVLLLAACGGSPGPADESAATNQVDASAAASVDENGNRGAPKDVDQLVADLEPPNATENSRNEDRGIIYITWETTESQDALQGFYDAAIADAGYTIFSQGSGGLSYEWVFAPEQGSDFRGVVTVSPGGPNGGLLVAIQVGTPDS